MNGPVRVVAVTGAPGVGKTSVGTRLGRLLPGPTVTVDTDALACVWPWQENDELLDLMATNLVTAMPRAVAWGARTIVVSGVMLPGRLIPRIRPVLEHPNLEWAWYGLRARPETLARRIAGYAGVHDPALRSSMALLDRLVPDIPGVVEVATDNLALDDVVGQIVRREALRPEPVPDDRPDVRTGRTDLTDLCRWASAALIRRGVPAADAADLVDRLVAADVAGSGSHGLVRIPEYCAALDSGEVDAAARPCLTRSGWAWLVDGKRSGGWHTAGIVSNLLADGVEPATVVRVSRGGHLGRLGDLVRPAAEAGRVVLGFATFGGTGQKVAAAGTTEGSLGTNPIVLGFPAAGPPVVVDVSTSAWSEGAVRVAADLGAAVPAGVLLDRTGSWTHDPRRLYATDPYERAALAPLGPEGTGSNHKGFALGVVSELLGGALGGGLVCEAPAVEGRDGNSALFVSVDPERLGHTAAGLRDLVARLEHHLASRAPLDPDQPVRLPGRGPGRPTPTALDLPSSTVERLRALKEPS